MNPLIQLKEGVSLLTWHRVAADSLAPHELRTLHQFVRLGKKPPKRDVRALRFAKYAEKLAAPPASVNWSKFVRSWPMLANDRLGDCTCAAYLHMIQAWRAANGALFFPTDDQAIAMYEAVGGYVPGNPETDEGANEIDVLNYCRQTGVDAHKILAYVAVNPQNPTEVRQAINLFGGIYVGLAMPLAWQGRTTWDAPSDGMLARFTRAMFGQSPSWQPGSWGGHAVPVLDYDEGTLTPITWGSAAYRITSEGFAQFCDEAYAIVTPDFIGPKGVDPQGFDLAQLQKDLAEVSS